ALGMTDSAIHMAFIIEAGGIGLIGSIFGVIFGAFGNFFLVNYGINFGMIMRDMDMGYRIQSVLKGAWNPSAILIAFLSGIILSMLVAWIPTRRALKMDIPACLRHQ
ncbi:MAG: ABC transporter permease, partial [Spirochaetae bacterium HGW-Spirochaetae-8]